MHLTNEEETQLRECIEVIRSVRDRMLAQGHAEGANLARAISALPIALNVEAVAQLRAHLVSATATLLTENYQSGDLPKMLTWCRAAQELQRRIKSLPEMGEPLQGLARILDTEVSYVKTVIEKATR